MDVERFDIAGPIAIRPLRRADDRGHFAEIFRRDWFTATISASEFVQENESLSVKAGTIRGLHFQSHPFAQGKLVRCAAGALFDVAVDIRQGSPDYGRWINIELSAENGKQLWIPAGFAHGFCTLEPNTVISYKVTAYYSYENDIGFAWDDPDVGVEWPLIADPATLSPKDKALSALAELPAHFTFEG